MKVCYIFRDSNLKGHSIEEIFFGISDYLHDNSQIEKSIFFYNNKKSLIRNIIDLNRVKADIYHITGDIHYILPFMIGKKVVNTIHDVGTFKNLKGLKKWLYGLLWIKLPCLFADKITVVSKFTKNDLNKFFSINKVKVIYNPVNLNFSYSQKKSNNDKPNILQIGCQAHKNIEGLIRALKGFNCTLTLIGRLSPVQINLLNSNNISYKNYSGLSTKQIIDFYKESDIVTFISFHEGFGMPIIEANAIGRPIVVSNVCSLPEIAFDAALFVNPHNHIEIRNVINTLIADEKQQISLVRKGLKNIKRFSLNKIANEYLQVYRSI